MSMPPLPYQSVPGLALNVSDNEHIKLLAIFSYVWGALVALGSCLGIIYILIGSLFTSGRSPFPTTGPAISPMPPPAFGWFFIGFGCFFVIAGWTVAGLNFYSARGMQLRKRRIFSLVVAGLNCMSFPFGTALGVFTFIVLLRESVARTYQYSAAHGVG